MNSRGEILRNTPLFSGIEPDEIEAMLLCFGAREKEYVKREQIICAEELIDQIGVVLRGKIQVFREDVNGNRIIINNMEEGHIFMESLASSESIESPIAVISLEKTLVLWVPFYKIHHICSKLCPYHTRLISNMIQLLAKKNIFLNYRIFVLSQKTIRERVLEFLILQSRQQKKKQVEIPFKRGELAEYLGVDRSALSRELSRMQSEGILSFKENTFELL